MTGMAKGLLAGIMVSALMLALVPGPAQALPSEGDLVRVRDIDPGPDGSNVAWLTPVGDRLFFRADDGTNGPELWVSDGTRGGTRMVGEGIPGPLGAFPTSFIPFNGRVVFTGFTEDDPAEVQSSDGNSVARLAPGTIPYLGAQASNGKLFFVGFDGSLWVSEDGVTATSPASIELPPSGIVNSAVGGRFIFEAFSSESGQELYAWDGTEAPPVRITDVPGSLIVSATALHKGKLYFNSQLDSLWVTDGTPEGTEKLFDPTAGQDLTQNLVSAGEQLYFTAGPSAALWSTDGTEEGTAPVELTPGSPIHVGPMGAYAGQLLFSRATDSSGAEPWYSDGTPAGTGLLKEIALATLSSNPSGFTEAGGELFFSANDFINGRELWRSDGTPENTVLAGDINPGPADSNPGVGEFSSGTMVDFQGSLFFTAEDSEAGVELWRTADATAPNTRITKKPKRKLILRGKKRNVRVAFRFRANEKGATFQCKLDRKRFRKCTSPHRMRVRRGKHTFRVRAIDAAGNRDKSPAKARFNVRKPR